MSNIAHVPVLVDEHLAIFLPQTVAVINESILPPMKYAGTLNCEKYFHVRPIPPIQKEAGFWKLAAVSERRHSPWLGVVPAPLLRRSTFPKHR